MNNYLKEIKVLEESLLKQYCDMMIKTKEEKLKEEYLNMIDEADDVLLKINKLIKPEEKVINKNVENSLLEKLQNKIEENLLQEK